MKHAKYKFLIWQIYYPIIYISQILAFSLTSILFAILPLQFFAWFNDVILNAHLLHCSANKVHFQPFHLSTVVLKIGWRKVGQIQLERGLLLVHSAAEKSRKKFKFLFFNFFHFFDLLKYFWNSIFIFFAFKKLYFSNFIFIEFFSIFYNFLIFYSCSISIRISSYWPGGSSVPNT